MQWQKLWDKLTTWKNSSQATHCQFTTGWMVKCPETCREFSLGKSLSKSSHYHRLKPSHGTMSNDMIAWVLKCDATCCEEWIQLMSGSSRSFCIEKSIIFVGWQTERKLRAESNWWRVSTRTALKSWWFTDPSEILLMSGKCINLWQRVSPLVKSQNKFEIGCCHDSAVIRWIMMMINLSITSLHWGSNGAAGKVEWTLLTQKPGVWKHGACAQVFKTAVVLASLWDWLHTPGTTNTLERSYQQKKSMV